MMHRESSEHRPAPASPRSDAPPRPSRFSVSSGWIVAAGACIAVAMLSNTLSHYRTMLSTTTARLHLIPANVAEAAPDSASGVYRLADEAPMALADRL